MAIIRFEGDKDIVIKLYISYNNNKKAQALAVGVVPLSEGSREGRSQNNAEL